jgi:predicted phage terminase large subunit-like protein
MNNSLILDDIKNLSSYESELSVYLAKNHLIDFCEFTNHQYDPQWFHKIIAFEVEKVIYGLNKRLMIFAPAQHGKTELTTRRAISFAFGVNKNLKIALACYNATKAEQYNREIQNIIEDDRYRKLFPETTLAGKYQSTKDGVWTRTTEQFDIVGYNGRLKSVGIGGALSGDPVDGAVIDDPIKDDKEAQSPTYRDNLWNWYCSVLDKRLHNNSWIVYTCTRWHQDDLAGRLLSLEPEKWRVLIFPALREEDGAYDKIYPKESIIKYQDDRKIGDALWESKHSKEKILSSKQKSERVHASMDQQRPAPAEGGLFKRTWWRYWQRLPQRVDRLVLVMDCTFKGVSTSDYVVAGIFAKSGTDTYFVDMIRGKWDFPETILQLKNFLKRYPYVQEKYIEDKANGQAVIDTLKKEIVGMIPITPHESKESRAYSVSHIIESGHVYLPENSTWKESALMELSVFPNGVNDDIVDVLVHALMKLYSQSQTTGMSLAI